MLEFLTLIISLLKDAITPYLQNQLPEARQFRGSGWLLWLLVIELILLVLLIGQISDKTDFYKANQTLFDKGVWVVGVAGGITALLYVWGLQRQAPVQNAALSNNLRNHLLQTELAEVAKRQEDSLHSKILIPIEMTDEREQVGRPSKQSATSGATPDLPPATRMVEVFRRKEVGGRLLILGDPGVGKTAMLLELAKALLEEGQQDAEAPVPIILELSTWREEKGKTLKDWLVEQLCQKYRYLGQKVALEWLESGQILPLLDGLDELGDLDRQKKAIAAINAHLEGSSAKLVVCCRLKDYKATHSQLVELQGTAVRIQAPTEPQIEAYLTRLNKAELWQHIQTDANLLKLAKIPLFLYMMVDIDQRGQSFHSKEKLWNDYIERRFEVQQSEVERPKRETVYPKGKEPKQKKTCRYLVFLAKQMQQHNQTEFWIEKMQPDWLEPFERNWYYKLPLTVLFVVLPTLIVALELDRKMQSLCGGITQLPIEIPFLLILISTSIHVFNSLNAINILEAVQVSTNKYSVKSLFARGLVFGLVTGLTTWGINWWGIGMFWGSPFIAAITIAMITGSILADDPSWSQTRERIKQCPEKRSYYLKNFRFNLLLCQYFCLTVGLFSSWFGIATGGWRGGLISGLLGLFSVMIFSVNIKRKTTLSDNFSDQTPDRDATTSIKFNLVDKLPNQGIKVYVGITSTLIMLNLILHFVVWQIPSLRTRFTFAFGELSPFFLMVSLLIFLLCGGFVSTQHLALRLILWCKDSIPWNYDKFLKYTAELRLIQQVGGRYRFIHPLLRDHFAAMR